MGQWFHENLVMGRKTRTPIGARLICQGLAAALRAFLGYLWYDERHDCEDARPESQAGHINTLLRQFQQWLDEDFSDDACRET